MPIYTNFEGERASKKNAIMVKIFKKFLKTSLWPVFPKCFLRRRNFGQNKVFLVHWDARKINLGDLRSR